MKKKKIFLSYSRVDLEFVEDLARDLMEAGYIVWFDLSGIEGGDRWAQEIQKGINQSEIFALVVSPNSIKSEWVEKEFLFASKRGMKIVPLLYELCELPLWLLNIQYIDIVGQNYRKNFHQIEEAFNGYGRRAVDKEGNEVNEVAHTPRRNLLRDGVPRWIWAGVVAVIFLLGGLFFPASPISIIPPTATFVPSPTSTPTATPISPTVTLTAIPAATDIPTIAPTATEIIPPTPTPLLPNFTDGTGTEMALIPAGTSLMGSDAGFLSERPAHMVELNDFYIDKYEVSNAQYRACVEDLTCELPTNSTAYISTRFQDYPVVFVNWEMAETFCEWRGGHLPTEAQWEKAARGTDLSTYPWGSSFDGTALNFCDMNCTSSLSNNKFNDHYTSTSPVGFYEGGESMYGVYDLAGNVVEWTQDWYVEDYYLHYSPLSNPQGPDNGIHKVLRGGSWLDSKEGVLSYRRVHLSPVSSFNYIGFRCAMDVGE